MLTSGIDTFSHITFDKARKSLDESGVPIYAIGLMQFLRTVNDDRMGPIARMDCLPNRQRAAHFLQRDRRPRGCSRA